MRRTAQPYRSERFSNVQGRINRLMDAAVDRPFLVFFARHRRALGEDQSIEQAWRRASRQVAGYLMVPFVCFLVMVLAPASAVLGFRPIGHYRQTSKLAAGIIGLVAFELMRRRLRQHLAVLPPLEAQEPASDRRYALRFRVLSIGIAAGLFALVVWEGSILRSHGLMP